MKKLLSTILVAGALLFVSCNNEKKADSATTTDTPQKVEDPSKAPASPATAAFAVKAHSCGADCKDGKHVYAHGDVGHTCTEACGGAHACTAACKDGAHAYVHGEAGHTCTEACMKS